MRPHASTLISRRRFWLVVVAVLVLIVLFEVGIRHVPPDGMTVTYTCSACGAPYVGTRAYSAHADQQAIEDWYTSFNDASVVSAWRLSGCTLTMDPSSVVFTWHGIPVEAWTLEGCRYAESAGGMSDALVVQHLVPIAVPPPSPSDG